MGGEWRVENERINWDIMDELRDEEIDEGIKEKEDLKRGENEGV